MPPPPRNKALIFGLIKGNQWVFIVPDHKAGYFLGYPRGIGGVPLDSHDIMNKSGDNALMVFDFQGFVDSTRWVGREPIVINGVTWGPYKWPYK